MDERKAAMRLAALFFLLGAMGCPESSPSKWAEEPEEPKLSEAYKEAMDKKGGSADVVEPLKLEELKGRVLLTEALTDDPELREILDQMKGHFSGESAYGQLKGRKQEILPDLRSAILHREPNVRSHVAEALGYFGRSSESTRALLDALNNDPDTDVRANVAKALVEYRSRDTVPDLVRMLRNDENSAARGNAAWALYEINDPSSKKAMMEALRDVDGWVRVYAVKAMKKMRVKEAIPQLKSMRGDRSPTVQRAVEKTLKSLGVR